MCSARCPVEAIHMAWDEQGFYRPQLDQSRCVDCGLCQQVCYRYDQEVRVEHNPLQSMSAINRDEETLYHASSGAVSIELMRECLRQGYVVVGVAYDYVQDKAVTKIAKTESELLSFRGSKYFQSETEPCFREILQDATDQKYAIFGTPCQIYGFYQLLAATPNQKERFLLVDIFCHGCPSKQVWDSYVVQMKQKLDCDTFQSIQFRSKARGWHEFTFSFETEKKMYHTKKTTNHFYDLFFSRQVLNEACYACKMRSSLAYTDVRLGDFWGHRYDADRKGVSCVVVKTPAGQAMVEKICSEFKIESVTFQEVIAAQSYGKSHQYQSDLRKKMLVALAKDQELQQVYRIYFKSLSKPQQIQLLAKRAVKILPQRICFKVKQLIHKNVMR